MKKALALVAILLCLALSSCYMEIGKDLVTPGETEEYTEIIEKDNEESLDVDLKINAAKAYVSSQQSLILDAKFIYNSPKLKPEISYSKGNLKIANKTGLQISTSGIKNEWHVKLADFLPMDLNIDSNASSSNIDLSGMMIEDLVLKLNASSSEVGLQQQNKGSIDNAKINLNAGDIKVFGLGNLNAKKLSIDVNAGSGTLDFAGDILEDCDVNIEVNAGSVNLKVPDNVGIRINKRSGALKNIGGSKSFVLKGDILETANYESASVKINLWIDANAASVDID